MNNNTLNNKNVPKLRFDGFCGEWEEKKLGEILNFLSTNSFSREQLNYSNGKIRNIHYGDIHTKFNNGLDLKKDIVPYINGEYSNKIKKENYCKEGDLIVADASEDYNDIGKTIEILNLEGEKVVSGLHTLLLRKKQEEVLSNKFSGQFMKSNFIHKQIMRIATGVSVLGISKNNLAKIKLYIPKKEEQQKIANFLTSVDEYIENLKKQKEDLELYKKGIMQKIFNQEIRFKDEGGKDFLEWEEKELKEFLRERKTYSKKGNGYPHVSLTKKGIFIKLKRYNRDFLVNNDKNKKYKITHNNDLCYNPANLKFGVICLNKLGAGIFSPIYTTFEIIHQNINFIGYYLTWNTFINKVRRYEQGTVYERMAVHPSDFIKVKLIIPSIDEQQKIVDFLTSIDDLIELKNKQINQVTNWKKGLMQKMFI